MPAQESHSDYASGRALYFQGVLTASHHRDGSALSVSKSSVIREALRTGWAVFSLSWFGRHAYVVLGQRVVRSAWLMDVRSGSSFTEGDAKVARTAIRGA